MDPVLEQKLETTIGLRDKCERPRTCKICESSSSLFDIVDFQKICSTYSTPYPRGAADIEVKYYRCVSCEFIFTDFIDDWTNEELSRFIYNEDYILADPEYESVRPLRTAVDMAKILDGCQGARILDYGSGSGIFARAMKERGFSAVESYDPFSSPARPEGRFDLITAFEVVEHSPRPLETFADMRQLLAPGGALLVGQTLQPANIEELRGAWWYLAPRNGHVSTYSDLTFSLIARKMGLSYRPGGVFCFSSEPPAPTLSGALDRIGPVFSVVSLSPPAGSSEEWHGAERDGAIAFRWTAKDRIDFGEVALEKGVTRFVLPIALEVSHGFAASCALIVGGEKLPTTPVGKKLVAEVSVPNPGAYRVELETASPVSARDLGRSSDSRPLGLAVPVQVSEGPR
jgi:hypothetical protein